MPAGESIPAAEGIAEDATIGTATGSVFTGPR
jgi:hypothetical protein